jgi:diguanylate cyclase (GGDEF)-like protein
MSPARLLLNFMLPCAVLVAAWFAMPALSALPPSLAGLRLYGAWALIALGIVIALAFRRGRIVFALLTLAAAHAAYTLLLERGLNGVPARGVFAALCLLVPLNLAALCVLPERGIFNMHSARRLAVLACEAACAAWLAFGAAGDVIARLYAPLFGPAPVASAVPQIGLIALALAFAVCVGAWLVRRAPLDLGFAGTTAAVAIALHRIAAPPAFTLFVAAAALLLVIALLQDTFRMAFRDELTGLPSRRDLNERLMGLGRNYTIAMLDVDHFKKFNDTYGHDVGDQVLKMVAAKMAAVGGGGTAYRYGGEEFTVLFNGRDVEHALPHLEALRREIEQHRLALRAADRPARSKAGKQRRGGGTASPTKAVAVTISIGVAARDERLATPAAVIRAADKALYRAKRSGRNQISR